MLGHAGLLWIGDGKVIKLIGFMGYPSYALGRIEAAAAARITA